MSRTSILAAVLGCVALPAWGQPREFSDDFTTVATYDDVSLYAPCSSGPSTKYTAVEAIIADIYNEQFVSGGGRLIHTNREESNNVLGRMEAGLIGVVNLGQGCPDVAGVGNGESTEPFSSDNVCIYGGAMFIPWQVTPNQADEHEITGLDGQPGVANVDDDLDGTTDEDDESPAARPTTVGGGFGNADGTGFPAGQDGAPGVAGTDDDGNGTTDDLGETGWAGSDDGDDGNRQSHWYVMEMSINTSSFVNLEIDPPSDGDLFNLREVVGGSDAKIEGKNEILIGFYKEYTHYNWVFCASGTCYGAVLWTEHDMANPNETLGPRINTNHGNPGENIVGVMFFQQNKPAAFLRRNIVLGNSNFSDTYWVVSGNPAQHYPSPSADLDNDRDVDGADFLVFAACFNASLNPPLPACANLQSDLDGDGDVDGGDFLSFAACFNGSLNKPLPACFPPDLTSCP